MKFLEMMTVKISFYSFTLAVDETMVKFNGIPTEQCSRDSMMDTKDRKKRFSSVLRSLLQVVF